MASSVQMIPVQNWSTYQSAFTATFNDSQDTNSSKWTWQFAHGSEQRIHYAMVIPNNYIGGTSGLSVTIRMRCNTATTGNVQWKAYGISQSTINPAGAATSWSATATAVAGTAGQTVEVTIPLTAGTNFNPAALFPTGLTIARDGGNASDTCTASVDFLGAYITYSQISISPNKTYLWIPAGAMPLGTNQAMNYGSATAFWDSGGIIQPAYMQQSATATYWNKFFVPSNWTTTLNRYVLLSNNSGGAATATNTTSWGYSQNLGSEDPALTAATAYVGSSMANLNGAVHGPIAAPGTPLVSSFCAYKNALSASTGTEPLIMWGELIELAVSAKNPQVISCDPGSWSLPTGVTACSITTLADTNTSKAVAAFTNGQNQYGDLVFYSPALYASGGTVRMFFSGGNTNIAYRMDVGYGAVGASGDPALTTGTITQVVETSNGLFNQIAFTIPAGLAVNNFVYIRFSRQGTNGLDTSTVVMYVHTAQLEINS